MGSVAIPSWQVLYGGINITGNLIKHAAHIFYYESIGGQSNTLEIALEDGPKPNGARTFRDNPPTPGTAVSLSIGYQGASQVNCGQFEVDEWESTGPPDIFVLRCLQAGVSHALRTPKSVAYEGQTLTSIATMIAGRYGMTAVLTAVQPDVYYARLTQKLESDLAFLHRIANLHNYDFSVRGDQLVFYSRPSLELAPVTAPIIYKTDAIRFRLQNQRAGNRSYSVASVGYFDPLSKQLLSAEATDPNSDSLDTLKIVERIENKQQATLRAGAHLHAANMYQVKGEILLPGTMLYRAGNPVTLSGFGAFDSVKFMVQQARHRLSAQAGYQTSLEIRTTVAQASGGAQIVSNEYTSPEGATN